jgi:hypothetical protein
MKLEFDKDRCFMAVSTKVTQLEMFRKEKEDLANSIKESNEESLKKQVRLHFHEIYEIKNRLKKQEEHINSLLDFLLADEKTP